MSIYNFMGRLMVFVMGWVASPASAHKPSYSNGEFHSQSTSYVIKNIDVSIVLYHNVKCEHSVLWMKYSTKSPKELFLQLGIPELDRLKAYRPHIAVLAKGFPTSKEKLPFEIPKGFGIKMYKSDQVNEPEKFDEPFSRTSSWVLLEKRIRLTQPGEGYIVAWHPKRKTGKLWVAVGEREDFGLEDFKNFAMWMTKTQQFHESGDYVPKETPKESFCPTLQKSTTQKKFVEKEVVGGGCDISGTSKSLPPFWFWLCVIFVFGLYQRRLTFR